MAKSPKKQPEDVLDEDAKEQIRQAKEIAPEQGKSRWEELGKKIDKSPEKEVVVRPSEGGVSIYSRVEAPSARQGFEKSLYSGSQYGLEGWERGHATGAGIHESRHGISLSPREVNQILQNQGIEDTIRTMERDRREGVEFYQHVHTQRHEGTMRLKSIDYEIHAVEHGRSTKVFDASITLDRSVDRPNPQIECGKLDAEPFLRPAERPDRRQDLARSPKHSI